MAYQGGSLDLSRSGDSAAQNPVFAESVPASRSPEIYVDARIARTPPHSRVPSECRLKPGVAGWGWEVSEAAH